MFPIWNLRAGPRVPDRVLQRSSRLYISLSETWVSIVWVKPWESYMIARHTPGPNIGFHNWNRFLCEGWRLIANLLLTRLASMFACNSGASRQFDTYLMDRVVMRILEGKGINWTKDLVYFSIILGPPIHPHYPIPTFLPYLTLPCLQAIQLRSFPFPHFFGLFIFVWDR